MDRLSRYASWIVENQDKQGTTEFETVANAYKQLRGASGVPAAPIAPSPERPLPDASERNLLREAVVDPAAQVFKGAATGVRFLTDVLGADNPISRTVGGAEDFFDSLLSAQSKRDQQEVARILEEAEDKGLGDQIKAGLQALTVAPVDLIANAFGTSVPTLAAGLLGSATRVGAGAIATGVGALTGVGITKSAVYEAVLQELVSSGVSEENAKEAAKEAQAYGGENLDNIALGGALGALAARFGLEDAVFTRAIGRRLAKEVPEKGIEEAAKSGVIARASRRALEEAIPEALQGGQEQFAQNIALQREGFDTPTLRGVAAGATLEGAVGAPVGAIAEAAPELASKAQEKLRKEINLISLEEAERLVGELGAKSDVERKEAKIEKATKEQLDKFLAPFLTSIEEAEKFVEERKEKAEQPVEEELEAQEEPERVTIQEGPLTEEETKAIGSFLSQVEASNLEPTQVLGELAKTPTARIDNEVVKDARNAALKLQLTEAEAFNNYESIVVEALAQDGYKGTKNVQDFFEIVDNDRAIKQKFPNLSTLNFDYIKEAQRKLEDVQKGIFVLAPTTGRIVDAAAKVDPSLDITELAEREQLDEFYSRSIDKLDIKEQDINEIAKLQTEKPARDLKGTDRKTKELRKAINTAGAYFKLPFVSENPQRALSELAYDLANDPTAIVENIQEETIAEAIKKEPDAVARGRTLGKATDKTIKKAIKRIPTGLRRGEKIRTETGTKNILDAVNWLLFRSDFSNDTKENFLELVKEFRAAYKSNVLRNVRDIQLTEQLEQAATARQKAETRELKEDKKAEEQNKKEQAEIRDKIERRLARIAGRKIRVNLNDSAVLSVLAGTSTLEEAVQDFVFETAEQAEEAQELEDKLNAQNTAEEEAIQEEALREIEEEMKKAFPKGSLFTKGKGKLFDRKLQARIKKKKEELNEIKGLSKKELSEKIAKEVETFNRLGGRTQRFPPSAAGTEGDTRVRGQSSDGSFVPPQRFKSRKALPDVSVDPVVAEAAATGNLNRTVDALVDSMPKELRPLIRRMRNMARGVTIRLEPIADPEETGRYYFEEKVIALDPERGLNKETLFHELSHAALDSVLANRDSEQVKQLFDFYSSIKTQMGDAYGGEDLYEFVAELVGNSEFQNLLKEIKAPKSKSLWETIVEAILDFFGVRKGQSAYDESLKFLNDIITARPSIEPNSVEKLFLANTDPDAAMKEAIEKFPPFRSRRIKETIEDARDGMSDTALAASFGAFRLDNLNEMFGDKLKALKDLISNIEKRQAKQEKDIESINKKYNAFKIISEKYKPAYTTMSNFAIDMSRSRVDIFDVAPDPSNEKFKSKKAKEEEQKRLEAYKKGKATYERIGKMEGGKAVQDMYRTMRGDYDRMWTSYSNTLLEDISDPKVKELLRKELANNAPIAGFMPLRRYGDFVLVYKDKTTGEETVRVFESRPQRDREIEALKLTKRFDIQKELDEAKTEEQIEEVKKKRRNADLAADEYFTVDSIEDLSRKTTPPEGFVANVVDAVKDNAKDVGLSDLQVDRITRDIREAYIDFFPNNSLMQSFRNREDIAGASTDVIRTYGDTMVRWSRKLADLEYNQKISDGFNRVRSQGALSNDRSVRAAAQNIGDREDFTLNPTYNDAVRKLTSGSYFLFMSGNISSALVNLSSVPLLSYPILASRHGAIKTAEALKKAGAVAVNDWSKNAKYATLYKTLDDHGQLRHTLEREVLEGARQATEDYNTIRAKAMSFLSFPISATERLNRATTGIMAYDLMKAEGKSDQEAADYALKIVKDVNTSGMSTTAPKWMQSNVGRVAFTFKGFIWQSTYVTARAFYQAVKGQDSETKKQAFKQLLYMYGISFAVGGTFGLPLFGAVTTLAEMVAAIAGSFDDEDDAPFNAKQALREMGLSQLVLKGPLNEYLNIEVSNRASIANGIGFREDPYDVDKYGRGIAYGLQLLGPSGSYVLDGFETVPKAFEDVRNFELGRGIERLSPSWLRNGIKTNRFLQEGARTRDGRPIDTDVNGWNLFMQALGFTPADVSNLYEVRSLAKSYENRVLKIRSQLLKERYLAITTGDTDLLERVSARINNFRRTYPQLITGDTLARSFRSRSAAEREYVSGIRYSRNFRRQLDPLFRSMDNVTYYGGFS